MNKLQESFQVDDRRFQALIENSIEGIALVSADGMIVYESPNVRRMMGYYPEELVGRHIFDFLHSGDRAASSDLYARALQQPETPIKGQFRYRHKNGSWRWLEVTCTNRLFDPAINAIVVNFHDVTDRVQAEIAQQASETRLASVIDSVMDAVISLDADQRIILFNEAAEKMFGYQAAEVMGQPLDCLLPPRFRNVHARHIRVFGQTGVTNRVMGGLGVISGLRANGEEFPLEASISQVEIRGEKLYTAILRDITERHRAEAALHQSRERLKLALAASQMGV